MAKVYFQLPGYYEGLKAKRIKHSGRLWLVKIVNDPPPYWFVIIRNFNLKNDAATGARSMGVWRFQWFEDAKAKFAQLLPFFPEQKKLPTEKQLRVREAFAEKNRSRDK